MRYIGIVIVAVIMFMNPSAKMVCQNPTLSDLAAQVDMTEEEFIFLSSVVEAESDRSDDIEGRVMIAITILNRVQSDQFPDTIEDVLTQRGQFSTVCNGHSIVDRTELSDQAVLEAVRMIEDGEAPAVMYFNCIGFFSWAPPYEYVGGNYFSLEL